MTTYGVETAGAARTRLEQVARVASDPTGTHTFARYRWQAKQAALQWLSCLSEQGPSFVLCEHVEDVTLVYPDRFRFIQLKTRDRGSWSVKNMCKSGFDSLVKSYMKVRQARLHGESKFELWLEGPISEVRATVKFVDDPATADVEVRRKLVGHGLNRTWEDDFLSRLVIRHNQPTQGQMDAHALYEMGSIWPDMSMSELEIVYVRLLETATVAQEAGSLPPTTLAILSQAKSALMEHGEVSDSEYIPADISRQTLSREMVTALTPPLPGEPLESLTRRLLTGSAVSMLELKMRAGRAREETIQEAKHYRADMEVQRQLLIAQRVDAQESLEGLSRRTLSLARAVASQARMNAAVNPVQGHREAEVIATGLLSRLADLGHCDYEQIFGGNPFHVYGYLAHLSDKCNFPWRAA